jgi:hypothetical protein
MSNTPSTQCCQRRVTVTRYRNGDREVSKERKKEGDPKLTDEQVDDFASNQTNNPDEWQKGDPVNDRPFEGPGRKYYRDAIFCGDKFERWTSTDPGE